MNSPCAEVTVLARIAARDVRSSLGKNLTRIKDLTHLDPWTATKAQIQFGLDQALQIPVPARDQWRPGLMVKMLAEKSGAHFRADEEEVRRITALIESLATN